VATLRVFLQASSSFSEGQDVATFARNVAQMCHRIFFHVSRHFDNLNERKSTAKPRTERSLLFPSKEFREEVRKASKARGFPLRSNKRLRPPPLTARTTVRNGLAIMEIYLFFFEQQNRSKQGKATKTKNNTVPLALLPTVDLFIFLLREKTRAHFKRGSLRRFVLSAPGCP
jgi:hypothetical protein